LTGNDQARCGYYHGEQNFLSFHNRVF
jgi:hypothetical protein